MRVVVVGAGIVGVAIAHELLDRGHTVELIDRGSPEPGASAGNAGWIAHLDVLPLASPKAWAHMPRWMVDPLGPLTIAPAHLPKLVPWLLRFVAASRPARIAAATTAIRALNARSLPAWERRLDGLGLADRLRRRGILSVWTDARDHAAAAGLHARQREMGIAVERLDGDGVRDLEPAFGREVVGGAFYPDGVHVGDPATFTAVLRDAALARGARLRRAAVRTIAVREAGVSALLDDGGVVPGDRLVVAGGAWSKPLAAAVGDRVPLDTERGYNVTVAAGALGLSRPVMYEGNGFVTTPLDCGDRIGGAVEFAGLEAPPNWARVDAMLGRLKRFLPDVRVPEGVRWMGFRPSIPDSLPVIGRASGDPRVVHAFGHGHYGLTQAAATAEIVAALVDDRAPPLDPAPWSPARF